MKNTATHFIAAYRIGSIAKQQYAYQQTKPVEIKYLNNVLRSIGPGLVAIFFITPKN